MQTNQLSKQVMLYGCLLFLAGETALAAPPKAPMAQCSPAKSYYDFKVNQVRAALKNDGSNFMKGYGGRFYTVGDDPRATMYCAGLWMGGMQGSVLRTAGQTYLAGMNDEFWPGPLDKNAAITSEKCSEYDQHFFVSKEEVEVFKNGGMLTDNIKNWPGNSTVDGRKLAAFVDKDNDNKYDPTKGDYPIVKGDGISWTVYNDKGNVHTNFLGQPIGIEIQQSTYAFDNPYIHLDQTLFQNYKMTYLGSSNLDSFFVGLFTDFDLGYHGDDYIGCDPSNNMFFAYQGDDFDETDQGFGASTPASGIRIFEGIEDATHSNVRMSKFMYFTNGTLGTTVDPGKDTEMYRFLTGSWKNHPDRLTYGGTGYSQTSTDYADFAFPGKRDPKGRAEWSEKTEGNIPGDRRTIASMGPIKLVPGAVFDFTIGIPFSQEGYPDESLDSLIHIGQQQQEFFDNNFQMDESKLLTYWKTSSTSSFVGETRQVTLALNKVPEQDIEVSIVPDQASGTQVGDALLSATSVIFKAGVSAEQTIAITPIKNPINGHTVLCYHLEIKTAVNSFKRGQNTLCYAVLAKEEPIAQVNVSGSDGVPTRLGEYVVVRGLLYSYGTERVDPNASGLDAVLSIADATGGISIDLPYKPGSGGNYAIPAPDWLNTVGNMNIWVYGKVVQVHGMTVIEPKEFVVLPNLKAKSAKVLKKVKEVDESDFIVFQNCSVVDSAEWKSPLIRTKGVRFSNGIDTIQVIVPNNVSMSSKVPLQNVDIYGTGYQKDETSPFADNYSLRVTHEKFIVPHGKPVSVKELQAAGTLEFFPNPMTDALYIRSTGARIKSIEIFDPQGKKVFEQSGLNTLEAHVNVEQALSKGIYLLSIQQEGNKRSIRKVMVQE